MAQPAYLEKHRLKHGMCIHCGNQTHLIKGYGPFRKPKPLNTEYASNGVCLRCHPPPPQATNHTALMDVPLIAEAVVSNPIDPLPVQEYGINENSSEMSTMKGFTNDHISAPTKPMVIHLSSSAQSQQPPPAKNPEIYQSTSDYNVDHTDTTIYTTSISEITPEPSAPPENDINDVSSALHKSTLDNSAKSTQKNTSGLEENRSDQLWKKANMLYQVGCRSGLLDDKIDTAESAFYDAEKAMEDLLSITDSNDQSRIRYINFLIQVRIDSTRFLNLLGKYYEAQRIILKAKDLHQDTWNCKSKINWKKNSDATLVLVEINQYVSTVSFQLGNKKRLESHCRESLVMLRELQKHIGTSNDKMNSLLALTLAFLTIDEKNVSTSICDSLEAMNTIMTLASKYPENEDYKYKMAKIHRLSSFALRDGNQFQSAEKFVCDAIEIMQKLLKKHPNSVLYLYETYYCYCAYVDHLRHINKKGDQDDAILAALINKVSSANQILTRNPSDASIWDSLTCCRLEVSHLQEKQGNNDASLSTLNQAMESAKECVNYKDHSDSFFHHYDLFRVLTDRGRLLNLMTRYKEAVQSYADAEEAYRHHIWKHPKANGDDDFYRKVFTSSMFYAHEVANKLNNYDRAYLFLKSSIDIGRVMQTRAGKVSLSSNLIEFGKLNVEKHQYQKAIEVYTEALSMTKEEFSLNPWHYYIGANYAAALLGLANAYEGAKGTRNFLLETQTRREYLDYQAELHGKSDIRASKNDPIAQLRRKCTEVPKIKKYTLDGCSMSIYITSGIPGKDPLEDQARALAEDYDFVITEEVRNSFRELQKLAQKNNVSFQDLCDYALNK